MVFSLTALHDEPSAIRHGGGVRRIPGRTLGGTRTRRTNMHFSSSSGLSALSPSGRESVDPIAELLSQLSGVRRGGPPTSQLQQLQMQIQLERQQVTAIIISLPKYKNLFCVLNQIPLFVFFYIGYAPTIGTFAKTCPSFGLIIEFKCNHGRGH